MIYIDRDKIPRPDLFQYGGNDEEQAIIERLEQQTKFKQARFHVQNYIVQNAYTSLNDLFKNKCAYCESSTQGAGIIDHFRPSESVSDQKGQASDGYFWLSYTWFNLYLSCQECQRYKSNYFPVTGPRLKAPDVETYRDYDALQSYVSDEKPLFLDPCDRQTHQTVQFIYDADGRVRPNSKEANYTIDFLELNRPTLVEQRLDRIKYLNEILDKVRPNSNEGQRIESVLFELNDQLIHQGLANQWISEWYANNEKVLEEFYPKLFYQITNALEHLVPDWKQQAELSVGMASVEAFNSSSTPPPSMRISSKDIPASKDYEIPEDSVKSRFAKFLEWVEIINYKCIDHEKLKIPQSAEGDGEQSILLIGENGVGKSTVLQAISLAMMGNKQLQKMNLGDYNDLINYNAKEKVCTIVVKFLNEKETVEVKITPDSIWSNREELVKPTIGVGSVRRMPEDGEEVNFEDDPSRIMGLFRHDIVFPKITPWLSDTEAVSTHLFDEAAKTIMDMLMIPEELITEGRMVVRRSGNITVNVGNGPESIKSMCDGYRSVIGYALYIMRALNEHWESAFNAEGLIIIDEIGNHLHPTWKIKVVSLLRQVFPRCTLMISTHDPLCLRAARKGEVWVMNLDEKRKVKLTQKDIPMGMSIENLLVGDWFYMEHTTDALTSKLIEDHSKELFKENPDQEKVKKYEAQLEQTVMQTSTGISKLDSYFDLIREVKSDEQEEFSKSKLQGNPELRKRLADRIRNRIKK